MSLLTLYDDDNPEKPVFITSECAEITELLAKIGVRFERWRVAEILPRDVCDEDVMRVYSQDIERLKNEHHYQAVDIIRIRPDNPKKDEFRQKFLEEHTHDEDEVRFFVEGSGVFYMRVAGYVYMTLCERGDLISVPAGVRHWFDMSAMPYLTCIRLFTNPEGWVAHFTNDNIARYFPKFEKQSVSL